MIRLLGPALGFAAAHLLRLTRRRIGIAVVYHAVGDPAGDPARELVPTLATRVFRSQVRHLRSCYRLVTASELPAAVESRRRWQRIPAAITFDDDLRSHAETVAPILEELGTTATFFLTGASLDAPRAYWWHKLQAAADRGVLDPGALHQRAHTIQLMDPAQKAEVERDLTNRLDEPVDGFHLPAADVRKLAQSGCEIGFHTRRHPYLPTVSEAELADAMREGLGELVEAAGAAPTSIAYPHGGGGPREADAARAAGFRAGYTTMPTLIRPGADRLLLGRVEIPHSSAGRLAVRLALRVTGLR